MMFLTALCPEGTDVFIGQKHGHPHFSKILYSVSASIAIVAWAINGTFVGTATGLTSNNPSVDIDPQVSDRILS